MKKICGIVVTYNRLECLKKNLQSLLSQTVEFDCIYVVNNNSIDGTTEYLNSIVDKKIIHICLSRNICGAGGFFVGVQKAFESGYEYIVLMDDDGYMADDFVLETMTRLAEQVENKLLMLNPLVLYDENNLSFRWPDARNIDEVQRLANSSEIILDRINPFNGTLISRELINTIGFPNKELVIRGDETEYELRAKKAGAFVATILNAHYFHPHVRIIQKCFFGKMLEFNLDDPWMEYYRARNYRIIYGSKIEKRIKRRIWRSLFLHDDKWIDRVKMIKKGLSDGRKGVVGMTIIPGENKLLAEKNEK